jgi:hypothetical protein
MDGSFDPVEHPSHYTDGKYEVIDFIESRGLGFHLGNAVKYISRAGKKEPGKKIEDLRKAMWYLRRAVQTPMFCSVRTVHLNSTAYEISVQEYCEDKKIPDMLRMAIENIVDAHDFQACSLAADLIQAYIDVTQEETHE